jgi:cysteine-rich repeat protein
VDNLSNSEQQDNWLAKCNQGYLNNQLGCGLSITILAGTIDSLLKQTDIFGYCQYDQTLSCKSDDSCFAPVATYKLDVLTADFSSIDDYFSDKLVNKGPCVKSGYFGTQYNKNKMFSCSWDCQNYGAYCGDGLVQSVSGEDCDDKDKNNLDACNNSCLWVNTACKEKASFTTSTLSVNETYVEIQKNPAGAAISVNECFVNSNSNETSNGAEVCRAYGLYCKKVTFQVAKGPPQVYGDFPDDYCDKSFDGIKSTLYKNNPVRVECGGIYAGPASAAPVSTAGKNTCGNGIQETYDKNGDKVVEKCDLGAQNGIACTPEYSKSCTYCAADCKEVLTKDSSLYCGNGVVDQVGVSQFLFPLYEGCEMLSGGSILAFESWTPSGGLIKKTPSCNDQGSYTCIDCKLSKESESCVACGKKTIENGGAIANATFLNPMIGSGVKWPAMGVYPNYNYVGLYRKPGGPNFSVFGDSNLSATGNSFSSTIHELSDGLESDSLCAEQYNLFFNFKGICKNKMIEEDITVPCDSDTYINNSNVWSKIKKYGDLFVYPVNKEKEEIRNEFIYSPAVPENTFRVVVRWSDKEGNVGFMGNVYNLSLNDNGPFINQISAGTDLCTQMIKDDTTGYWGSDDCISSASDLTGALVRAHDSVNLEKTYAQAMTVKAVGNGNNHLPFAFFVEAVGDPIYNYASSPNVSVEVYTYHKDQIPDLSVYAPTSIFKINEAENSTNASAYYWHVFNLEYVKDKYEIVPVQKVRTDWCEVQEDIPLGKGTQCSI